MSPGACCLSIQRNTFCDSRPRSWQNFVSLVGLCTSQRLVRNARSLNTPASSQYSLNRSKFDLSVLNMKLKYFHILLCLQACQFCQFAPVCRFRLPNALLAA